MENEKKKKGSGLSSIAPGYIVADVANNMASGNGAADAASAMAQGEAAQAAWNEPAMAATASETMPGLGGIAAGAATGYQQIKGTQAALKGKEMSMPQQVALALPTFGLSMVANKLFGLGGSRTNIEEKMREDLAKQEINVANAGVKEWELNEKFKASRDEKDLVGKDIINSAKLWQLQGYKDADAAKQEAIANKALELGIVREHHGTMDFADNADFAKFASEQLAAKEPTQAQRTVSESPRDRKVRKKAEVDQVLSMGAQPTQSPRYDINLSDIYKNPYL
jgi:hypothetical protein